VTKNTAKTRAAGEETPAPTPRTGRAIRLKSMDDVRVEMAHVYTDARQKRLEPEKASKLIYMLTQVGQIIEGGVLERRIKELEGKRNGLAD
jgi:hypothetical protein